MRQARQATTAGQARGRIIDAVSIRERPAAAADRAVPGHWEGDLLSGARNSHIATLVERRSRFVLLVRLPGKDTVRVVRALSRAVRALPAGLMASLTWDRGGELAAHRTFTVATDVQSTSATRRVRGSAAPTRTPTDSCASISRAAPTSRPTRKRSAMPSPSASIHVRARHWATSRLLIHWPRLLHR